MARRLLYAAIAGLVLTSCAQDAPDDPAALTAPSPTEVAGTSAPDPSGTQSESPSARATGQTMREAIAAYLATQGLEYAGDCAETDLSRDIGKYCSQVVDDRGLEIVARIGPTFSEYQYYLLVRDSGGWEVVRTVEIPYPEDDGTLPF